MVKITPYKFTCKGVCFCHFIGRQPDSEKKRSGFELAWLVKFFYCKYAYYGIYLIMILNDFYISAVSAVKSFIFKIQYARRNAMLTELGKDVSRADIKAQYDGHAKNLVKYKPILARILKNTTEEFASYDVETIETFIEQNVRVLQTRHTG